MDVWDGLLRQERLCEELHRGRPGELQGEGEGSGGVILQVIENKALTVLNFQDFCTIGDVTKAGLFEEFLFPIC